MSSISCESIRFTGCEFFDLMLISDLDFPSEMNSRSRFLRHDWAIRLFIRLFTQFAPAQFGFILTTTRHDSRPEY